MMLRSIKKGVSYLYRAATTAYPCYLPVLGEFSRSWPYKTYPGRQKYKLLSFYSNEFHLSYIFSQALINYSFVSH